MHDSLLLQATKTMTEMSKLAKDKHPTQGHEDELDTFGKFIVNELRGMQNASTNSSIVIRQAKRKIQQILMDTWDIIDSQSTLPSGPPSNTSHASQWSVAIESPILDTQREDSSVNFTTIPPFDVISSALNSADVDCEDETIYTCI